VNDRLHADDRAREVAVDQDAAEGAELRVGESAADADEPDTTDRNGLTHS